MRRASFISPITGEVSKRQFTLRDASSRFTNERSPLLGEQSADRISANAQKFTTAAIWNACSSRALSFWDFARSPTGQGIFKCSIAYLIGSMATLVPAISQWFGSSQDSKHMVATVTVYFHAARTAGSMHEASVLALIAFCYASFISFSSMGVSILFAQYDLLMVGHAIVLVVFVAGGFGLMAWVKLRLANPLVNVATSLASLGTITVLIREGSVQAGAFSTQRVTQVLGMIILGMVIASLVNIIILPSLARKKLSTEIEKNTDLLGEVLISITRAFLHGRESELEDESFKSLNKEHQSSLSAVKKILSEAKRERYILGDERIYAVEARLVSCLETLSQDLGGLSSAARAQFTFINQPHDAAAPTSTTVDRGSPVASPIQTPNHEPSQYFTSLDIISESPELPFIATNGRSDTADQTKHKRHNTLLAKSPGDMFVAFISQLGPPTKSLVYTLKQLLDELPFQAGTPDRNPWAARHVHVAVTKQFHSSLRQAVELYRQSRKDALSSLYQNRAINAALNAKRSTRSFQSHRVLADIEEVSACCGHFSFSLLDFAEDVFTYLDILDDLKLEMDAQVKSWRWLIFWKPSAKPRAPGISRRNTHPESYPEPNTLYDVPAAIKKVDDFADPEKALASRPWYYSIYKASTILRRDDVRFAIKVGFGAALYALPAFLPETRPLFLHWRGEWGLVSYMVVCCMTVGASNTTGFNRMIGTVIGAGCAVLAWLISNHDGVANPYLLGFFGWLMSVGCFYIIIAKGDGPMGRFIVLTYNLGALYSYSLSIHDDDNDDDEGGIDPAIWSIVLHRVVSVLVGTIWAIIICRWVAPISARRKLREGMCILWLRMGLIWKRDPLAMFLLGEPRNVYMDIREEAELHSFLASLRGLLKAASSEFEFSGPFPEKIVSRMLERAGHMLDAFHAMNVVISKNLQYTPGEATLLRYTRPERFALSARISHLFTVLASSITLEYPLNDVLPNIDDRRDRLLAKISQYRGTEEGKELTTEQDYEVFYAFVLVTGQLAQDITAVGAECETLYGTLNEENLKLD
ncbi:uncharacterized protein MYCGRDRAFT_44182 [Zymoseptoria tritici IPO323]|uniref:Integral membrane bound transporter domain-containing protein n=1 Tax=Zymoseptoria tritici (strain CBS 115943 / IPO323) TaxID=336722 RepID=F9XD34_ZYMTI|nr:uncharacterized protein MYCGRDRAFT_44182 [Zymoseptoria tritici IPO323]EGP86861.1 hypothetical protein MYCGRDRAFT_44182 [Zymoseptoria tritici IPO323]